MICGQTHPHQCECAATLSAGEWRRSARLARAGAAVIAASFAYAPWVNHGPVICPMRLIFGIPCPGCGLTRSFCAIARGNLSAAFGYHALGPVLYLVLLIAVPLLAYQAITHRRVRFLNDWLFGRRPAYAFAAVLFAYHAARLSTMIVSGQLWGDMQSSLFGHGLRMAMHLA